MLMRALCVRDPWAGRIMNLSPARKSLEIRSRRLRYEGPLVIVQSQPDGWNSRKLGPGGRALGVVDMVNCRTYQRDRADLAASGGVPWQYGLYAWVLVKPRPFPRPFPVKGQLGLFTIEVPATVWDKVDGCAVTAGCPGAGWDGDGREAPCGCPI